MRFYVLMLFVLFSSHAFAKVGESRIHDRFMINGFYGFGFINPSDINNVASSQATTPKLGNLSGETFFGGSLGYMILPRLQLRVSYEMQDAKNPVNTTSPSSISNAGFELIQNEIWGAINFFFLRTGRFYAYGGGSLGYPTYSHVTATLASKTEYDADKTLGYMGQLGVDFLVVKHFSIFAEGGYQSLISGDVKTSSGTALTISNGSRAKMNLSGGRVQGGVSFWF